FRKLGFLVILISLMAPVAFAQRVIRCESDYGRRHVCSFEGFGRASLSRQLSRTACVEGRTWGREGRNAVWVSDGCRADFVISREGREERREERHHEVIVCESDHNDRHFCRADTQWGVRLSRQLGRRDCIRDRTWGYNDRGIWVSNGCRAEFVLGR
ncbi:MAG: DUF3011 domain-containing protein, partial [Thermoanaerobaculia bacterium]